MDYKESAQKLKFSEMKFKDKAKRILFISSYVLVFACGGYIVPKVYDGWNLLIAPFFEEKPYIAPIDPTEQAILDDMATETSKAQCRDFSVQRVKLNESKKKVSEASDAYSEAMQAEARISSRSESVSTLLNTANLTAGMDIRSASNTFKTGVSSTK